MPSILPRQASRALLSLPGIIVACLVPLIVVGCGRNAPPGNPATQPAAQSPVQAPSPVPARRIISLAPSLTELAFAAGAGDRLVGTVAFSDHPEEARQLPRVGDAFRVDYETIAALHPDLILGWPSGNSAESLRRLRRLGYRVVDLEPETLDDINGQIIVIGELAGTFETARVAAEEFAGRLGNVRARYRGAEPIRVFFQVAPQPLITVTARHFIGQAIEACGGVNVFGRLDSAAPVVGRESVLAANPQVIVGTDYTAGSADLRAGGPLDEWRQWQRLPAVAAGNLFVIDPDLLSVPSPRMLEGIELLCADLDVARGRARASAAR